MAIPGDTIATHLFWTAFFRFYLLLSSTRWWPVSLIRNYTCENDLNNNNQKSRSNSDIYLEFNLGSMFCNKNCLNWHRVSCCVLWFKEIHTNKQTNKHSNMQLWNLFKSLLLLSNGENWLNMHKYNKNKFRLTGWNLFDSPLVVWYAVDQFVRVVYIDSITVYMALSFPCSHFRPIPVGQRMWRFIIIQSTHAWAYTVRCNCKIRSLMPINNYNIWDNIYFEWYGKARQGMAHGSDLTGRQCNSV